VALENQPLEQLSQDTPLLHLLQLFKAAKDTQLVVIFDQFERFLVNVSPEKRRSFIQALKQCMDSELTAQDMNFLFVLRQEFFGQMVAEIETMIPTLLNESGHFNLQPLSQAEAREAIIQPLDNLDVKIMYDEAFVDEVLLTGLAAHSSEHTGINPPHLQIVCNQLYEAAHQRLKQKKSVIINAKLYKELGGVQTILQTYLDKTVENIAYDPEKTAIVRSMLKTMIETVGTRKFVSLEDLRRALPDVVETEVIKFLDKLHERRVIELRQPHYSLSHEFMVEKVRSWFDEREMARQQALESLERGMAEWHTSEALLNEKQVNHIRKWLSDFTENEQQLLAESEKAIASRKRREEEQKRQLAASKAARKRAVIVGVAATTIGLVFALFFGIRSYYAKIETARVAKQDRLNQFESHLTNASLMVRDENYAAANTVLKNSYPLDQDIPAPRRHARNLLDRFDQIMGGVPQQVYQGAEKQLETVLIIPDRQLVVAGGWNGTLAVFDRDSGQLLQRFQEGENSIVDIVFHPQEKWLASVAKYDNRIVFWSLTTGKTHEWPIGNSKGRAHALAISADGRYLASNSNNEIILWPLESGQARTLSGHEKSILQGGLAFHPTQPLLASASYQEKLTILWDVNTGNILQKFKPTGQGANSITFSPDGQYLATGCHDKMVCLWDIQTGELWRMLQGHTDRVSGLRSIAEGRYLISASWDQTLRLWDIESGVTLRVLEGHTSRVTAITTDGKELFSASHDDTVRRWQTDLPYQHKLELPNSAVSSRVAPDGASVALGFDDGSLRLYSLPKFPKVLADKPAHSEEIAHIAFSADSRFLATVGFLDNTAKVWQRQAEQLELLKTFPHPTKIEALALSPKGQKLATAIGNGQIGLFSIATEQKHFYQAHQGAVYSVDFDATGTRLVSGGEDGYTHLWNLNDAPTLLRTFPKANNQIQQTTFSPDGQWIASVSNDKIVHIYNTKEGKERLGLVGHENTIIRAIFSPDSHQIVTVSLDNTARIWDLTQGNALFTVHLPLSDQDGNSDFYCLPQNCWLAVSSFYPIPQLIQYEFGPIYETSTFEGR